MYLLYSASLKSGKNSIKSKLSNFISIIFFHTITVGELSKNFNTFDFIELVLDFSLTLYIVISMFQHIYYQLQIFETVAIILCSLLLVFSIEMPFQNIKRAIFDDRSHHKTKVTAEINRPTLTQRKFKAG
jgi:hypothetical protein